MTWAEGVALLGDVGSLGVVATLVYLTKQVRDANRLATFTAVQANRAERRQLFLADRESAYLPEIELKIARGEPLDPIEERRYRIHIAAEFASFYSNWVNRDIGLMGEYALLDGVNLDFWAQRPMHLEWFRNFGGRLYPPRFCNYVETELARRAEKAPT